jgi:hypothetical protein
MQKKSLTDILRAGAGGGADWINDNWGNIAPAPDFGSPVPKGNYVAHVLDGALFNAGTGTPGYKVTFEIIEGEYRGRRLWYDIWLTGAAKSRAVRDLAKLGIRSKEQLEQPIPSRRIRCKVRVVVHCGDDSTERNVVKHFEVLGIDPPEANPFAPGDGPGDTEPGGSGDSSTGDSTSSGELFPFGANQPAKEGPYGEGR